METPPNRSTLSKKWCGRPRPRQTPCFGFLTRQSAAARPGGPIRYLALPCVMLICLSLTPQSGMAIIGGSSADWGAYPWLVKNVILDPVGNQWVDRGCSSVVVGQYYALTAGHCLNGPYTSPVGIQFSNGEVIQVTQEIRHPDYKYDSDKLKDVIGVVSESVADIGLQRLAQPVGNPNGKILNIFNSTLPPSLVGEIGTVLGWGATSQTQAHLPAPQAYSPILQQIQEVVQDNQTCQRVLDQVAAGASAGAITQSPFRFDATLFCAVPSVPSPAGVCTGDSGPLFRTSGNNVQLLGFVTDELSLSFESPCGNGLDIYTMLTPAYLQWIRSIVPADVSPQFSVTTSGLIYSPVTKFYSGTIRVVNNGPPISGPVSVVLTNLTPGITVVNPAGTYGGDPYISIPAGASGMSSGQSATAMIRLNNPSNLSVQATLKTYSGALN